MSLRDEVTVVVITRDRAPMLRQALTSACGQQGGPVPVVCVVDGSDGETTAVLAEFPQVQVVRHPQPRGPAAARNAGLAAVGTPWVAFLDDDDVWAPDKLLAQRQALAGAPQARWCHTGAMAVTVDLTPVGAMRARHSGDVHAAILTANVVCGGGSSVYAHTETVRRVGGFDPTVRRHEDWDLWIRLAAVSPLAAVDRPLVGFRRHPVSRSGVAVQSDAVGLLSRYADDRRRLGVTHISHRPIQAVHDNPLVRGSRIPFARAYFRAGIYHRSPRLLAAAFGSLSFPHLLSGASRWHWRTRTPASWFADVETWLPPLAHVAAETVPVSVIIPAYQRADMIARAVRSALEQVPQPAEVIVVDDGSSDGTADVAAMAGARVVRLAHNRGEGGARNAGLDAATSDWVALLDSDDEWLPGHLARVWAARIGYVLVADSCVGDRSRLRGGNPGRRPRVLESPADLLWPWSGIPPSCVLLRRADAIGVGGFRPLPLGADLEFWLRLLERGPGLSLSPVGCVYHEHAGQVSAGRYEATLAAVNMMVEETAARPWNTALMRRRILAVATWDLARGHMRAGRRRAAARILMRLGRHARDAHAVATVVRMRLGMRVRGRLAARHLPATDGADHAVEHAVAVGDERADIEHAGPEAHSAG